MIRVRQALSVGLGPIVIGVSMNRMCSSKGVTGQILAALFVMGATMADVEMAASALPETAPVAWLAVADKSQEWKTATQRCRELLQHLNLEAALVQKYLPKVKEKAQLLLRSPDFDWKKKTAVYYLENMLEDLMAGLTPHQRYAGQEFGYPYWSKTMERIEAIWVHVPPEYDPVKSYQFFMYYKCGGGIHLKDGKAAGGYRPTVEVANQTDSFHAWSSLDIQVKGRMGAHVELEEATAALGQDFSVDPDRIFLTGWSDGGFTALWLGSCYPHLVAGIAPVCGNWQYGNLENIGLLNLPTLAVDGWSDGGYNNLQFSRWLALRGLGADARCIWGHHGHSYQPYEDVEEFKYLMNWAKDHKRDLYPRKVRLATWNLAWNRAYWIAIERVLNPVLAAQFEAEVMAGNQICVQAWNVAAYKLALSSQLVDPLKPIRIVSNSRQSYLGPCKPDLLIELAPKPEGKFVKDASLPDDITAAIKENSYDTKGLSAILGRQWLSVRPTGWSEQTAGLLAKWPPKNAKADSDINENDMAQYHLLVYGGPDINKLTARMFADLPVKFGAGKFTLGNIIYDRPSHSVAFIHPNPLNPQRYVIVYAFNDAETFVQNGFFGMTGGSFSEFRAGDCLVFGIPVERGPWGAALDNRAFTTRHVMFDAAWKADTSPPLGELERSLDYAQILRLKADAVREATGADAGIIWEHTPTWNRWGDSLPAGPVTLHDLATVDMFPESIVLADMTGADLRRAQPAASTMVADQRESAYDGKAHLAAGDLVPAKTYRVAMGYFGQPAYGAEPGQMPKLFPFATPEDFLAVRTDRIPLKNVRQLPLQVVEAIAQFIRQHSRFTPRRVCFDLTQYVMNPQANDYGACDWLHLGLQTPLPGAARRRAERYTLNLGLRGAEDPDPAPPRSNSKHFLDLSENMKQPAAFNFADLEKQLPIMVSIRSEVHAITAEKDFKSFGLAPTDTPENKVGRCLLLNVKLVNIGQKDIEVTAVLSAAELRASYGQVWPDEDNKAQRGYYAGYHRAVGEYQKPPVHEDAALLLFAGTMPKTVKLMAPNAGYNFGLAGIKTPQTLKAAQTLFLPLLWVAVDIPRGTNVRLADILASLKGELAGGNP